jgi:hypothetical protein
VVRELGFAVIAGGVCDDPVDNSPEGGSDVRGQREPFGELRLSPRALEEYDDPTGDGAREFRAVVFFDEREREVDAGGDPGRGREIAIADEDPVGLEPSNVSSPPART